MNKEDLKRFQESKTCPECHGGSDHNFFLLCEKTYYHQRFQGCLKAQILVIEINSLLNKSFIGRLINKWLLK